MASKQYGLLLLFLKLCTVLCADTEKISLTFVIDTTSSMHDDISETIYASRDILDIAVRANSSRIENFVLVTFNDPEVNTEVVTKSPQRFLHALNRLRVNGGGDCPEMSMSGIEEALEVSLPGSLIYVFTDASAKDHWKVDRVKELCQRKQSRVIFVLTGKCGSGWNSRDYQVYHEIAATSSGQVFHLKKSEVSKVLASVPALITGKNAVLTSKHLPSGCHDVYFNVDDRTSNIIVSVSGEKLRLSRIHSVNGDHVSAASLVATKNIEIIRLINASPGVYWTTVCSNIGSTLVITGETDLNFQHGFSEFKPKSIEDTSRQPVEGRDCYLSIALEDPERNIELTLIEILDINENTMYTVPLAIVDNNFYVTDLFKPPELIFKIAINGYDTRNNNPIRRISKTAIEPKKPDIGPTTATTEMSTTTTASTTTSIPASNKAPVISKEGDKLEIEQGSDVELTCRVFGHPSPDVVWEYPDGKIVPTKVDPVVLPYEHVSYLKLDKLNESGIYKCKASNSFGSDVLKINVKVKYVFKVLETPTDKSAPYGTDVEFPCRVETTMPVTIKWYVNGYPINNNDPFELSENNSKLTIKNVKFSGNYRCEVSNGVERKMYDATLTVNGLVPPKLDKSSTTKHVKAGSLLEITCPVVEGKPEPHITWYYKPRDATDYYMIRNVKNTVKALVNAGDHKGHYRCNADNAVGHDFVDYEILVNQPPEILRRRGRTSDIVVKQGIKVNIPCRVRGEPMPQVYWLKDNNNVTGDKYTIEKDNSLSFVADAKDADDYICVAINDHGEAQMKYSINVLAPPIIDKNLTNLGVRKDSDLVIKCKVQSNPTADISWSYKGKRANEYQTIKNMGTVLKIPITKISQGGSYRCKAENKYGVDTHDVQVSVEYPPEALDDEWFVEVREQAAAKLPCDVAGIPKPMVKWLRNGRELSEDRYKIAEDNTLSFVANVSDTDTYICMASNNHGFSESIVKLNVLAPPKITNDQQNNTYVVKAGDGDLKIPCKVTGNPKPAIVWNEKGKYIIKDSNYDIDEHDTLIIKKPKNKGTFSCFAGNVYGNDQKTFHVIVQGDTPSSNSSGV